LLKYAYQQQPAETERGAKVKSPTKTTQGKRPQTSNKKLPPPPPAPEVVQRLYAKKAEVDSKKATYAKDRIIEEKGKQHVRP
jgi:hypothetical protein